MRKLLTFLVFSAIGFAQVRQTIDRLGNTDTWVAAMNFTASSVGAVPSTVANVGQFGLQGYVITHAEVAPGATQPTPNFSVTLTDASGVDLLQGAGVNLSASSPTLIALPSTTPPLNGTFTFNLSNNSVASATGVVYVFIRKASPLQLSMPPTVASGGGGSGTLAGDVVGASGANTVVKINNVLLSGLGTGIVKNTTATGAPSIAVAGDFPTLNQSTTGSAATLTTPRAIYGNNFDGSAALAQIIASTFGGTGNGFAKFAGPAATEKTFTLPNASATILTDSALVTVPQGGTGVGTLTGIAKGAGTSAFTAATASDTSGLTYIAGGGTAQAQTATLSPAITAQVAGQRICWLPVAANTAAAPTLSINGLTVKTITKLGTAALVASDLTTTAVACAIYDGTNYQLQNPQSPIIDYWVFTDVARRGPATYGGGGIGSDSVANSVVRGLVGFTTQPDAVSSYSLVSTMLPPNWTGAVDLTFYGLANGASGNVRVSVATGCIATGENTTNITYNTATTSTIAISSLASSVGTFTGLNISNCSAGEQIFFYILRLGADGADTLTADMEINRVVVTTRRSAY